MSKSGKCLCGDVSFTYDSDPGIFLICHCTDCQKSTGSPLASIIVIPESDFKVNGSTGSYECEAKVTRSFCKNCGSRVPRFSSGRGAMMVPIGSTMDSPEIEPTLVCLEDHTDWFTDLEKLLR